MIDQLQSPAAEEATLTRRQQEILEFIQEYLDDNGYPPTVRDIGGAVGLTSSSTVHAHLANLEKAGAIRRDPTKPRALEILGDKAGTAVSATKRAAGRIGDAISDATSGLPLIGQVAAGGPIVAEQNIEEYIDVPRIAGGDSADFVLSVRGDSMEKAGILDGDFVVVKSAQTARDGEIVVALIEDSEATLKYFRREGAMVRLDPANRSYDPQRYAPQQVRIQGRLAGLLRRYD